MAPHPRFRGDERDAGVDVPVAGESELTLSVHVDHSGEDVESASLILHVRSGGLDWRIVVGLQVRIADGMPQPRTEHIDVQEAGVTDS